MQVKRKKSTRITRQLQQRLSMNMGVCTAMLSDLIPPSPHLLIVAHSTSCTRNTDTHLFEGLWYT